MAAAAAVVVTPTVTGGSPPSASIVSPLGGGESLDSWTPSEPAHTTPLSHSCDDACERALRSSSRSSQPPSPRNSSSGGISPKGSQRRLRRGFSSFTCRTEPNGAGDSLHGRPQTNPPPRRALVLRQSANGDVVLTPSHRRSSTVINVAQQLHFIPPVRSASSLRQHASTPDTFSDGAERERERDLREVAREVTGGTVEKAGVEDCEVEPRRSTFGRGLTVSTKDTRRGGGDPRMAMRSSSYSDSNENDMRCAGFSFDSETSESVAIRETTSDSQSSRSSLRLTTGSQPQLRVTRIPPNPLQPMHSVETTTHSHSHSSPNFSPSSVTPRGAGSGNGIDRDDRPGTAAPSPTAAAGPQARQMEHIIVVAVVVTCVIAMVVLTAVECVHNTTAIAVAALGGVACVASCVGGMLAHRSAVAAAAALAKARRVRSGDATDHGAGRESPGLSDAPLAITTRIAKNFVGFLLDDAELELTQCEAKLPHDLFTALVTLLDQLDMYRPYLPDGLVSAGSDGGWADDCVTFVEDRIPPGLSTNTAGIMFTDIKSSTRLWDACPGGMRTGLKIHHCIIRQTVQEHSGYEVKTIGDAFMVAFDTAIAAVRCALAIQERLVGAPWPADLLSIPGCERDTAGGKLWGGLALRIGVDYGEVAVEPVELTGRCDYLGTTVNRAAKIEALCTVGAVGMLESLHAELAELLGNSSDIVTSETKMIPGLGDARIACVVPSALRGRKERPYGGAGGAVDGTSVAAGPGEAPAQRRGKRARAAAIISRQPEKLPLPGRAAGADSEMRTARKQVYCSVGAVTMVVPQPVTADGTPSPAGDIDAFICAVLQCASRTAGSVVSVLDSTAVVHWPQHNHHEHSIHFVHLFRRQRNDSVGTVVTTPPCLALSTDDDASPGEAILNASTMSRLQMRAHIGLSSGKVESAHIGDSSHKFMNLMGHNAGLALQLSFFAATKDASTVCASYSDTLAHAANPAIKQHLSLLGSATFPGLSPRAVDVFEVDEHTAVDVVDPRRQPLVASRPELLGS